MYVSIRHYQPVVLERLGGFDAPDPWKGTPSVGWSLNRYAIVGVGSLMGVPVAPNKPGWIKTPSLGIQSDADGRYHLLPRSLADLVNAKQVPNAMLPALLRELEPRLEGLDFKHPMDS